MKIYKPEPLVRINFIEGETSKKLSLSTTDLTDVMLHVDHELYPFKKKQERVLKVIIRKYEDGVNGKSKTLNYYGIGVDEAYNLVTKNLN